MNLNNRFVALFLTCLILPVSVLETDEVESSESESDELAAEESAVDRRLLLDPSADSQLNIDNLIQEFPSSWYSYSGAGSPTSLPSIPGLRYKGVAIGNPQSLLMRLFDWNYEMDGSEFNYACQGMPDMERLCQNFSKQNFFYNMNPNCMGLVRDVGQVLNGMGDSSSTIQMAQCMRDSEHLNPQAWLRSVVMAMIQSPEMSALRMPPILEIMPSMFLKWEQMEVAKGMAYQSPGERKCVRVDGNVGADNGIENLLWYWREDVMLNSFHWYWHLTYPFMGTDPRGDRRGELFYYVHHSLVARYHSERLSMGLPEVVELELFQGTRIEEPYNSHLHDGNSGNFWTPRMPHAIIQDVDVVPEQGDPQMVHVEDRLLRLNRILQAIRAGKVVAANGQKVPLRNFDGIDILGDIIEASIWTLNQDLYGYPGVHNGGHILIGLIEDPQGDEGLSPGVMADPGTAMRDPVFYRYHKTVDNWFTEYKSTLAPYSPEEGDLPLVFEGVKILSLGVRRWKAGRSRKDQTNRLRTFFGMRSYDLARGLDFNRTRTDGPIRTCIKHLDYEKFNYEIVIKRAVTSTARATIRIFLAPRYNLKGVRYTLEEQRLHFFHLDRFPVYLAPGLNKIIRKSTESTLTIPFPQSYAQLQSQRTDATANYCGCGWPDNLLLPRGTINGLDFDLFVMVTNGDDDAVPAPTGKATGGGGGLGCRPAPIFCGIVGENYPDAKPMGYPFDRTPYLVDEGGFGGGVGQLGRSWGGGGVKRPVSTIEEWVEGVPNSAVVTVRIFHKSLENIQIFPVKSPIIRRELTPDCQPGHYNFMCFILNKKKKK